MVIWAFERSGKELRDTVIAVGATEGAATSSMQDLGHPAGFDYEPGSPHLTHSHLRNWIVANIREVIREQFSTSESVRVLEVGAGHGAFTDSVLAAGATVTVTEMSRASAELLRSRFAHNRAARVVFDPTGGGDDLSGEQFDVVLCAAVLHHIPDYLAAIRNWVAITAPGGAFLSFQDPMWYERRGNLNRLANRAAYYAWRLGQGDLTEGMKTLWRRRHRTYDESNPRDMVEYHVIRQGCDEEAIAGALREYFESVRIMPYWSTQGRRLQTLGERLHTKSTFAILATGRRA